MSIRNTSDFVSGLALVATGAAAILAARDYAMGTAFRMGPGYFPVLLGGLLALLGAAISLRALWIDEGNRMGGLAWRPVLLVLGGVLSFALLLSALGLVLASLLALAVSALATHDVRHWEVPVLSAGLSAFSLVVFVYGLGLPFKIWPV
ncbi:tripartite tricarboxylate transporter TctB family protein [Azospirillum agricola]|uniref:tripartite tricarboxylate transporter TctB family protein n=1 Tax=Azospirillum agricola TaxID=1720247 RepID=UPI000A0EF61C|nr:tripartite tricarboxylate transporter TctB family protein [Azospirillum agricola]SMH32969.1 Tripartite tricarboxylate transporter TctB family protein [Azospirillum lipoferum]